LRATCLLFICGWQWQRIGVNDGKFDERRAARLASLGSQRSPLPSHEKCTAKSAHVSSVYVTR
jgi:hypothetical protein